MAEPKISIVFITAGSREEAARIARTLVSERLAACCNVIDGVSSVYRWKGDVAEDSEAMIICKTRKSLLKTLIKRVREIHSYDVPEVISAPLDGGSAPYLKWLAESTGAPES